MSEPTKRKEYCGEFDGEDVNDDTDARWQAAMDRFLQENPPDAEDEEPDKES